ncbi:hypothetical protein Bhyg_03514 [Pseudolycoriella hygida]|uniref:Uncharacterized protein n=1 Tax=Pseudolycoriella hygida TaxID=35572 RepID=A0A9Q0NEX3_9DIPT|nr:hypothetical protein Bhyg_03514 [Pseudolycoriella hygida]
MTETDSNCLWASLSSGTPQVKLVDNLLHFQKLSRITNKNLTETETYKKSDSEPNT